MFERLNLVEILDIHEAKKSRLGRLGPTEAQVQ